MLSKRLLLFILLPLALAFGLGAMLLQRDLEARFEDRMQAEVEMVARALEIPVSNALERGQIDQIFSALESTERIGRVYSADIYDAEGDLIATTRDARRSDPNSNYVEALDPTQRDGRYRKVDGERVYSYFVSLNGLGGRPLGILEITRLESDFQGFMHRLRVRGAIGLTVLVIVVTIIVLLGYYGAAGRALGALRASIERINAGERDHRANPTGPTEIRNIATSFNTMLDTISEAEHELRQRRQHEIELQHELRRSEKLAAIGRVAGGVAHELGTPLSTVRGRIQRTLRSDELPEAAESELHAAVDQTRRMERIVQELLSFGRDGGERRTRVNLTDLIDSVIASTHNERAVTIEREPPDEPIRIHASYTRVERALSNVVENGLEAPGVETLRISWGPDGDMARVIIEDDGEGIPEDLRGDVLEPFFSTKPESLGTGLGLAIVDSVVEEQDGSIEIDDSPVLGGARITLHFARSTGV
ncbi:MAG: sensor histidine kinase [Myxococcota bacterium]